MFVSSLTNREITTATVSIAAALEMLERHQERRRQGVPTLTVIAAGEHAAEALVARWVEKTRPVCLTTSMDAALAIRQWFDALVRSHNLIAAAYAWVAKRAGESAEAFASGISARSPHERSLLLDRVLGTSSSDPGDVVCRAIVEHVCQNGSTTQGVRQRLLDRCGDRAHALAGVIAIAGDGWLPILHVTAGPVPSTSLASLVAELTSLASVVPALPIVVSGESALIEKFLSQTAESRALALAREGAIWLGQGRGAVAVEQAVAPRNATEGVPYRRATEDIGESDSGPRSGDDEPRPDDPARSAAERFLFERLQAHSATAGLFELNGRLEGGDKGRALEVDLLARGPRVAVEIDGYYHFTDLDAYRRDRRKDQWLQHAGCFVVRCLADDVLSRLEEILEAIVRAVQRGRGD